MTSAVKGRTVREAEKIFGEFHRMITGSEIGVERKALGKLAVFSGVREFPARGQVCLSLVAYSQGGSGSRR